MGGEVPHFLKYSSFLPHKNTNAILYVFNHLAHLALNGHSMVTGSRVTVRHRRSLKVTPEVHHSPTAPARRPCKCVEEGKRNGTERFDRRQAADGRNITVPA